MSYKEEETPENLEDDTPDENELSIDLEQTLSFEDEGLVEELEFKKKGQQPANRFSLKARRAIEDHIERRRLRKELDYLFDDEFSAESDDKKES